MAAELEKERAAKKAISEEKAALEAELESLSQALFEEVRVSLYFMAYEHGQTLFSPPRPTRWLPKNE